jgi:Glyoxalase-like domain
MCIERLCFGDFHLAQQQMKVTRLPGRNPAPTRQAKNKPKAKRKSKPMTTKPDHIVIVAHTLTQGIAWCQATLGITPTVGGQHPLMGTHNRIFKIETAAYPTAYFEIIAIDPSLPPPAANQARWFGMDNPALQARVRQTPELVHFVASTTTITKNCTALAALNEDVGQPVTGSRATPSGELRWQITVRPDGTPQHGGCLPALIQWGEIHPSHKLPDSGVALLSLSVRTPQADKLRAAYQAIALHGVQVEAGRRLLTAHLQTPLGPITLCSHPSHPGP